MFLSAVQSRPKEWVSRPAELPREVTSLFTRERELATIVYNLGLATAKDVETRLAPPLSNPSVRSILNRLVRKGILAQQCCGSRGALVYAPALNQTSALELAIWQFVEDFCCGSIRSLANELSRLFACGANSRRRGEPATVLPPVVCDLAPRMGEIASIVYLNGGATLLEVQSKLSDELTTSGLRTFLNRMVRRGIVISRRSGRHKEVCYIPAVVTAEVRDVAVRRLVDDRFHGSCGAALQFVLQLRADHARSKLF